MPAKQLDEEALCQRFPEMEHAEVRHREVIVACRVGRVFLDERIEGLDGLGIVA